MGRRTFGTIIVAAAIGFAAIPSTVSAQSAISGVVKDSGGGILPGVTVQAASPALIERVRDAVTDEQGRYTIVDLRPGLYKVTFALAGFTTLVRDGIDLPSNFTATVNVELNLGALEESVTVSGNSPIVDVQSAQHTAILKRELIDAIPTGRTYAQLGALAVGVKPNTQAVGGARTATQQRLLLHGMPAADNTIDVDGMKMNSMYLGGETQPNHNDAMTQEVTVQTSSPGAEVSAAGVHINLIPREGGNAFSGSGFVGYTGSSFQSNNLTPELQQKGLRQGDAADYVYDVNAAAGGPIKRDRLWFFGSYRDIANANVIANSFYPDGRPGVYDQRLYQFTVRLTSQLTPRNKLTAYIDRPIKNVPHDYASGTDVLTAARRRTDVLYYTTAVKWTSTVTNKLLLEAGWGGTVNAINFIYQPDVRKPRGTADWFSSASRQDIVLNTRTTAAVPEQHDYPFLYMLVSSASYVTGSHSFKTGMQWRYGPYWRDFDSNADLVQRYRSGTPDSVIVYNTPTHSREHLNADLGFYVQDSWKLRRLTLNPGIRFEYFSVSIESKSIEPGRFVGFRQFPEVPKLPEWFNLAPRLGAVYDLTGDARTALKFGVNRYNKNDTTNFTLRYNPASLQSDTRNWTDVNRDDIAQDNEIGPSNNVNFGAAPARHADPNIKRQYNVEYSVGVDRELFPGVSVTAAWYRRVFYNLEKQINTLVGLSDYTAFQTPSPLNGEPVTIYNLNRAKQGLVDLIDTTSTDRDTSRQTYDGLELSFSARLPRGASVFGGLSSDRTMTVACEGLAPQPLVGTAATSWDPNTFRYCDQSQLDIPFRSDFKLAGAYPIPLGLQIGANFQSYAGAPLAVNWAVPASVFPGGQRTQSVTVNLIAPGTAYLKRWNQLDLSLRRIFKAGRARFDASLDVFNLLNSNVVLNENQNFGASLGAPLEILQPRLLRISTNMKF